MLAHQLPIGETCKFAGQRFMRVRFYIQTNPHDNDGINLATLEKWPAHSIPFVCLDTGCIQSIARDAEVIKETP